MARCGCAGGALAAGGYIPIRPTPPDPSIYVAYLNSGVSPPVLMVWNGIAWVPALTGGTVLTGIDGGSSGSVYVTSENIDGGNAGSVYIASQNIDGGAAA